MTRLSLKFLRIPHIRFFRTITYPQALIASVIGHLLFFALLSLLAVLFERPGLNNPPLVFEFVFMPQDEGKHSGHAMASQNTTAMQPAAAEHRRAENREILKSTHGEQLELAESTPRTHADSAIRPEDESIAQEPVRDLPDAAELTDTEDDAQDAEDATQPACQPQAELGQDRHELLYLQSRTPTSFTVTEAAVSNVDPLTAKLAMTTRQRKMLRKKLRKWSENAAKVIPPDSTTVWKHKGKSYTARFYRKPARNNTDLDQMIVKVQTEANGLALTTEIRMKRLAFSNYAQFVDYWDPWVAIHDDEFEGRFHANSVINVRQSRGATPKFHGKVTTASYRIETKASRFFFDEKATFLGGLETGVKEIHLPRQVLPALTDSTLSPEQCLYCKGDVRVTFYRNGTVGWRTLQSEVKEQKMPMPPEAFYIIGAKKKKLHLRGVVKGKVLVYSPGKIIIDGDLTYARHPEVSLVAEDYLGIVSDGDVEIAHPDITGPGDLNIYASIYAKKRFVVKQRYTRNHGTLFIYGSLTAGSLSATEPRYGTRIRFDKRLEQRRPPNFPMTDRFEVIEWDGKWQVEQKHVKR